MAKIELNKVISPNEYFDKIEEIDWQIEKNIHDLVWKYGKMKVTKKYGTTYELKLKDCIINGNKGEIKHIEKVMVSNPENCQTMGHIFLFDDLAYQWGFCDFMHQQLNVYYEVFLTLKKQLEKDEIIKKD